MGGGWGVGWKQSALNIQGVPGEMDKTSGECSVC